jgi:hypothetical protein
MKAALSWLLRHSRNACLLAGLSILPAAAAEPIMVNGVAVEATAATAAAARDMAIADGQRRAFMELIEHLAPGPDAAALAKLPDSEVIPLIAGFEVADERSSATRWRATLNFAFDQDAVRALLRERGVGAPASGGLPGGAPTDIGDGRMMLRAPIENIGEWIALRQRLSEVLAVRELRVRALSSREAIVELSFNGGVSDMVEVLNKSFFTVTEEPDGWSLTTSANATSGGLTPPKAP